MGTKKRAAPRIRIGYTRQIFDRPTFENVVRTQLYTNDFDDVMLSYRLAKYGHRQQFRRDNRTRYFDHCKAVALIIILECKVFLREPICCGLMHDLKEDTFILSWRDVQRIFGKNIYRGLRILTKEDGKDYYWGLTSVESKDWWIILDKLADRLHNMRTALHQDEKFQRKQLAETEELFPGLIEVFRTKVPRRFKHLPEFFRLELEHACNRVRKELGKPKTTAFKRAA
jgi:(p)ppGpp synthase/HD superfamily hydrolase